MPKAPQKTIHPNSRKATALARDAIQQQRRAKIKLGSMSRMELFGEKLLWFQSELDPEKDMYTRSEMTELVCRYLGRFADELEQISIANSIGSRKGTQHASRLAAIRITIEREQRDYETCGLDVPDLISKKHLKTFRFWTGELRFIQNLKTRKISKNDEKSKSMDITDTISENNEMVDCSDMPDDNKG